MKQQPLQKTMASKMAKRMEIADTLRTQATTDLETLRSEAISKHDQVGRESVKLGEKLRKSPNDKNLQKQYAGAIAAKKMFGGAAAMNTQILKQEGEDGSKTD